MQREKLIRLSILLVCSVFVLASCSEPKVTRVEDFEQQVRGERNVLGYQVSFKANPGDKYIVFDENKECPNEKGYVFRTTKPYAYAPINKGDICTHCRKKWSSHKNR